ncbi:hypothetical protein CJP72_17710 [Citrobacter sp. NCU1]|nr:hypothetical protein [Citrobacter sp. NCU1]
MTVWLGCEQHDAIFGNYWLLIVFVRIITIQKEPLRALLYFSLIYRRTGGHPPHDRKDRSWS